MQTTAQTDAAYHDQRRIRKDARLLIQAVFVDGAS